MPSHRHLFVPILALLAACATLLLLAPVMSSAVEPAADTTAGSTAPSERLDPRLAAEIEAAPSLYDKRVGVSEPEPDYCRPELFREVNPNAANRDSIEIGPPKFLVEDLGATRVWRHCISVLNRFDEPRTIELSTLDLRGSPDPDVTFRLEELPDGPGSWIELPIESIRLAPGERVLVPYLLRLPPELPGGTVIAGIRITDAGTSEPQAGARITRSLVSQLQVTSPGGDARPLDIRNVSSTRFIWTGRDPEVIRATFTSVNTGTVVDTIEPRLVIDGLFGREVADIEGTPDVVIPDSAQRTTLRWDGVPFIGLYFPELRVQSAAGTTVEELPFVVVLPPMPYVVALGVALLVLGFGIWRRRRNDWRQYLDDDESDEWEQFDEVDPYDR